VPGCGCESWLSRRRKQGELKGIGGGRCRPQFPTMMQDEASIRLGAFLVILASLLVLERLCPWRQPRPLGWRRWPGNLGLAVVGTLLVRSLLPAAAVGSAIWAEAQGLGLLRQLTIPPVLAIPLVILLLDLLVYFQHRLFHSIPLLWRLHRVHHADPELDATSALRFHPLEILLSMLLKMAAVVMLGAPPVAVLLFEILLNGSALFNHAAIRLPAWLERGLRTLFVTPGMHRIHHSEEPSETDRCFGFCLSLWDRIFGTNLPSAAAGEAIRIGVTGWRASYWQRLDRLLLLPFR